ncbi:probable xylan 1,4-beta-xylosidase [Phialocephala subalpina]|uniref:Probable xylan 1,4-beta-xylosidase n=1 Tax=Phialocephala subalpina TaxID=576137 RepID=A0A1L7XLC9_9HELO|nr:probable xylan 1,4-beta-xylosidase [Phialocephala subalpina]
MRVTIVLLGSLLAAVDAIKNPIISGWNPDPSILRVGKEYFIATSSFEYFPGTPIYKSTDLANWELYSHAQTTPEHVQLYGVPTGAGVWAPSLSFINGQFYLASMTRWTYDPTARVWPRVYFSSSKDLITWTKPTWCEPWGIDPSLFQDPVTGKTYLNLMAPNNNIDRIWGIYQCEVSLTTGNCVGEYISLWNGTLPHNSSARDEGPKMFYKDEYYYLLIAEGGTDDLHRATIARSSSPQGPWTPAPNNPILFNGAYGYDNFTVQSTGHATFVETLEGDWYAAFLARRKINGTSPLGRETFLTTVTWKEGWPTLNDGKPILLSESFGSTPDQTYPPPPFKDTFSNSDLDPSWYQLRVPYTNNYNTGKTKNSKYPTSGIIFSPNVFSLSDRDTPSAVLRKQKSLNMTFSAALLATNGSLGYLQSVGISAYLSEFQHQDIGIRGCVNQTGMCMYSTLLMNGTSVTNQIPLNSTSIPDNITLIIRAEPLKYTFGFTIGSEPTVWMANIASSWLAFAPANWFVFEGASFALFASGNGNPWSFDAPAVGFKEVNEVYFEEGIPDHDVWA